MEVTQQEAAARLATAMEVTQQEADARIATAMDATKQEAAAPPAAAKPSSRFCDPYYFANALLLASYGLVHVYCTRQAADGKWRGRLMNPAELATWEAQAALTLVAIVGWKALWRRSVDHLVAEMFFWGKAVLALSAMQADVRLFAWYCLALVVLYAIFPQPMINLAASDKLQLLTPSGLKEHVTNAGTSGAWLVYYYADGQPTSVAFAPCVVELAEEYASEKLQFGAMDVSLWPKAAEALKVSSNTWSNQLPAVVLYDKGKEVGRLPPLGNADKPNRFNTFKKREVIKALELDSRALPSKSSSALAATNGRALRGGRDEAKKAK